jgi:tRNA(Ile)-lysidine synthase
VRKSSRAARDRAEQRTRTEAYGEKPRREIGTRSRFITASETDAAVAIWTALRAAVEEARAAQREPQPAALARRRRGRSVPLVVAFSGGRDSTVLLHACCALRDARAAGFRELLAVHVDHGLHAVSAAWGEHCRSVCSQWQVPLEVIRVEVQRGGRGLEAAAREARYAALAEVALARGARLVLTAHHRDDRIETFLIQWLRGAGADGLAAIPAARSFADGALTLVRPLLQVGRAQIDAYLRRHELPYIDDPSNHDTAILRNAIRARVLPELEAARPGFAAAAARSIELVADAAQVVRALAAEDLAACRAGVAAGALRLDRLAALAPERQRHALRAWLAASGQEAPSRARLQEVLRQALAARGDARLLVRLAGGVEVRRHRGLLVLHKAASSTRGGRTIRWQGQDEVALPEWGGALRFVATDGEGFDPDWLRAAPLEVRARTGGERFKPHPTRPSKTLKRLYQDAGIAEFERAALPLVWRDDRLIFVAGLGADARLIDRDGARVILQWQAAADLIAGA